MGGELVLEDTESDADAGTDASADAEGGSSGAIRDMCKLPLLHYQ